VVEAIHGVSFVLGRGEVLGVVGESGSGKSVTALSIMRLLRRPGRITGGRVLFKGRDLIPLSDREMQDIRGDEIAMVFQDPMTSLNPVMKTGVQVAEPMRLHRAMSKAKALAASVRLIARVDSPDAERRAKEYPHQFSGGMRQRAMIAMGISIGPAVLIADEPTTALDVTIQAQVLDLLRQLNQESNTAIILITHNLGVVAGICDRVLVMYAGRIVEEGPTTEVFGKPKHPYTWSLLRSIPRLDDVSRVPLRAIEGTPPDLHNPPSGCQFHPRCPVRIDKCSQVEPELLEVGPARRARCWVTQEGMDLDAVRT
jgi:oligopeptide/dipeptide ABC transporter ATP-binding protein